MSRTLCGTVTELELARGPSSQDDPLGLPPRCPPPLTFVGLGDTHGMLFPR